MKHVKRLSYSLIVLLLVFLMPACSKPEGENVPKGVEILAGAGTWLGELKKLRQPSGILPNGTGFSATNIIYRDPASFYEFFAFDENVSLILLSHSPVYFIKIESRDFRFHLNNELAQINQGLTGENKSMNSLTFYKKVGDHAVEVYFTPKELNFTSSGSSNAGKIKDKNDTTYVDLWRLYEAAGDVSFYTPGFDDQQIADDFYAQSLEGKRRLIFTTASSIASPVNYNLTSVNLNFSTMIGTNLTITDNLLGAEDINFQDRFALQREFGAFFSLPIGNSKDPVNDHLSKKDGIAVIIRGDMTKFKNFLNAQGLNLSAAPVAPSITVANIGDVVINEIGSECGANSSYNYVEIYNKSTKTLNLNGWKILRDSGTGVTACTLSDWTTSVALTGSIAPLSYKVIRGTTTDSVASCPAGDYVHTATMTIDGDDCVALTTGGTNPTSATDPNVMDFVGIGNAANTHEGAATAPNIISGSDKCLSRNPNGIDTNNNGADFVSETTIPCSPGSSNGTLNAVSARAPSVGTSVFVYFSSAPSAAAAVSTNYCIALASASNCSVPALSITGASISGVVATLTTTAQTANTPYTVYVSGVTAALGGGALAKQTANFTGFVPQANIAINEVTARFVAGAASDSNGDGTGNSSDDEFIEIINNEGSSIDISNWVLRTGATSPGSPRFTFPATTTLPAGGRVVVFGGGTPTGGFGGALTLVSSGLSLNDSPTTYFVTLESSTGFYASQLNYGSTPGIVFAATGASKVRNPEGTGAFVDHTTVSGNAGILWSPGVPANAAIPKVLVSGAHTAIPGSGMSAIPIGTNLSVQFNMAMNTAADFNNTKLKLFANSDCASSEVVLGGITASGSLLAILNNAALSYSTTYCISVASSVRSANNISLTGTVPYLFTTGASVSTPSGNVVISEMGGCRMTSSAGGSCATPVGNDEYVELYNPTASAISISGWSLCRRTSGGSTDTRWTTADMPGATTIAPNSYYLVGGAGYTNTNYTGNPAANFAGGGTSITTGAQSMLLYNASNCSGAVVDAISVGAISGSTTGLQWPALTSATLSDGQSIERKACYNSTGDANATTGMLAGGGHVVQGNSEKAGSGLADLVQRATLNPQNSSSTSETKSCP